MSQTVTCPELYAGQPTTAKLCANGSATVLATLTGEETLLDGENTGAFTFTSDPNPGPDLTGLHSLTFYVNGLPIGLTRWVNFAGVDGTTYEATTKELAVQMVASNLTIDALSPGALAQLLGADVTITQPIDSAGQIKLTRGMDYTYADNRALEFVDDKNQWPDLDTATVALVCWRDGANALSFPGTAPVPTGSSKKVRFELASADTQKLSRGEWRYGLQAVISTRTIDLVRPGKSLSVIQFN